MSGNLILGRNSCPPYSICNDWGLSILIRSLSPPTGCLSKTPTLRLRYSLLLVFAPIPILYRPIPQIFTSEDIELPRQPVADYLEMIDPSICVRYVEFLIAERGEESPAFHDRLAELYLRMTVNTKKRTDEGIF